MTLESRDARDPRRSRHRLYGPPPQSAAPGRLVKHRLKPTSKTRGSVWGDSVNSQLPIPNLSFLLSRSGSERRRHIS